MERAREVMKDAVHPGRTTHLFFIPLQAVSKTHVYGPERGAFPYLSLAPDDPVWKPGAEFGYLTGEIEGEPAFLDYAEHQQVAASGLTDYLIHLCAYALAHGMDVARSLDHEARAVSLLFPPERGNLHDMIY